uniref:NEDD8-activating enzyme E1 regulatory subunit n=1 Tax=Eutreptiella gymnastica TaxID=73025 RepID=A0A7S1JAU0_9EUGL|mmetsp:Transcript_79872/g.140973  ORF Transcript_79872/g.140973 Transcript_79872/m.140973 type:complete len:534 (+) Transcript_79872:162-1763(+)
MSSEEPSFREKKYDRQIRLWGLGGQKALETSKVCLLNATGVGTETLKNLVLPGIGSFTIVDGNLVTEADLGNNFFVTVEDLNEPRGERATKWLTELNPDVKGGSLNEKPEMVIETNPDYFRNTDVTLVIATQLPEPTIAKLASILHTHNIPLLVVRSYGLIGYVRVQAPSYAIVETFPDQQVEDYHVLNPFPELEHFVESVGHPDSITDTLEHAHIPWVCLMVHYLKKWKQENKWEGSELTYKQRKEVMELVKGGKLKEDEENFQEALTSGTKINPPQIPSALQDLMASPETELVNGSTEPFWFCMNALKQFYSTHKRLPINGKLNDMTSTTGWFIALQNVYAAKAQQDLEKISGYIKESINHLKGTGKPTVDVPAEYISLFCKNVWNVRYARFRTVQQEVDPGSAMVSMLSKELETDEPTVVWYLLLRAGDRFYAANNRFPGDTETVLEADVAQLAKCLKSLLQEMGVSQSVDAEYVQEWARYSASELHNISAVLGGVASQEAIKMITQQRAPMNNTLIFDGINGTMATYEL